MPSDDQQYKKTATCDLCGHPDKPVGKTRGFVLREKIGTSVSGGGTSLTYITQYRTVAQRDISVCKDCMDSRQKRMAKTNKIAFYLCLAIGILSIIITPILYFFLMPPDNKEGWWIFLFLGGVALMCALVTAVERGDSSVNAAKKCLEEAAHKSFATDFKITGKSKIE